MPAAPAIVSQKKTYWVARSPEEHVKFAATLGMLRHTKEQLACFAQEVMPAFKARQVGV